MLLVPLSQLDAGHKDHEALGASTLGKLREMELPGGSTVHDNDDCDDSDVVNPEKWQQIITSTTFGVPGGIAFLQYLIPEVSGVIEVRTEITEDYELINGQLITWPYSYGDSRTSTFYKVDYHSGFTLQWIGGGVLVNRAYLVPLDLVGEHYEVVRNGGDTHPDANFATNQTLNTLLEIAKRYLKSTGYKLSVNDLSLPWGGLFDIDGDWQPDHVLHRVGVSVDINSEDGSGGQVNLDVLEEKVIERGCRAIPSGGIHYECP